MEYIILLKCITSFLLILISILIVLLAVFIFIRYCLLKYQYRFWKNRRIAGPKIDFFTGLKNHYNRFYGPFYSKEIYDTYPDEPVVGLFTLNIPILLVKDLNMIEEILIKNFSKFSDRRVNPEPDSISENLFAIGNPTWKPLRQKLSTAFTPAKLKQMYDVMSKCTDRLITYLSDAAERNEPIELYELTGKFSFDVMALCLFSIDSNTLLDEDSEFQDIVPDVPHERNKDFTKMHLLKLLCSDLLKPIKETFKSYITADEFLEDAINNSIEYRKKNGIKMNDFLDLLMNLQDHPECLERKNTDNLLLAQAVFFFWGGLDIPISHALYELALNPHVQEKLRNEVAEACDQNAGKLDYKNVNNMKYLDKVLKETLRKYPVAATLVRDAKVEYTFHNTNISVPKNIRVMIPVCAIHYDPKIYPDPEKFDPERFSEDVANQRPKMSYLPFGDGPRICIAQRLVQNQMKLCIVAVVANFSLEICEKTVIAEKNDFTKMFSIPFGEFYLGVKKI